MSFISPWFLFGLLGIGIPLLIHLIRREKAAKLAFSTIRFLKKVPKKMTLFQEFQQWLLLLVRIAIIALLAIAFARPFLTAAFSNLAGIAPRSTIILVDTSMSMGYSDY
ncbi:MAG: BatA domain-containing protein, partial [Deltaproteobacteria bacterium]|nr:BatA domain-containing protein [Deltaproteobacteria bacterium]